MIHVRWRTLPRIAVVGLAGLVLACLNAPTGTSTGVAMSPRLAAPAPDLQPRLRILPGAPAAIPALAALEGRARPGRPAALPAGVPRTVDAFQRGPTGFELRAARVNSARLVDPSQPYVPVTGTTITIRFESPVNTQKVQRAFRVTPELKGELAWTDDRTLSFRPEALAYDTAYTVELSQPDAPDLNAAGWSWTFVTVKPVTITIDDCASTAGELRNVLGVLAQKHIKAIMFPTGLCSGTFPWLVPQMLADGHTVCNHTYSHPRLTRLSDAQIATEIRSGVHAGGCTILRPPWGDWDGPGGRVERIAAQQGYKVMLWDVDTLDWAGAGSADILSRIRARGGVILLHFHGKYTVEALRQL